MIHQQKSFNCGRKMVAKIMMMTIMMTMMMIDHDDDDDDDVGGQTDDEWDGGVRLFLCLSSVRLHR